MEIIFLCMCVCVCSYGLEGHGVTTPSSSLMSELIPDAFVIAIISFVINISQAKLLAKKNSYTVHPDQVRDKPTLLTALRYW